MIPLPVKVIFLAWITGAIFGVLVDRMVDDTTPGAGTCTHFRVLEPPMSGHVPECLP